MQNLLSDYNEIKPENNNSTISEKKSTWRLHSTLINNVIQKKKSQENFKIF